MRCGGAGRRSPRTWWPAPPEGPWRGGHRHSSQGDGTLPPASWWPVQGRRRPRDAGSSDRWTAPASCRSRMSCCGAAAGDAQGDDTVPIGLRSHPWRQTGPVPACPGGRRRSRPEHPGQPRAEPHARPRRCGEHAHPGAGRRDHFRPAANHRRRTARGGSIRDAPGRPGRGRSSLEQAAPPSCRGGPGIRAVPAPPGGPAEPARRQRHPDRGLLPPAARCCRPVPGQGADRVPGRRGGAVSAPSRGPPVLTTGAGQERHRRAPDGAEHSAPVSGPPPRMRDPGVGAASTGVTARCDPGPCRWPAGRHGATGWRLPEAAAVRITVRGDTGSPDASWKAAGPAPSEGRGVLGPGPTARRFPVAEPAGKRQGPGRNVLPGPCQARVRLSGRALCRESRRPSRPRPRGGGARLRARPASRGRRGPRRTTG